MSMTPAGFRRGEAGRKSDSSCGLFLFDPACIGVAAPYIRNDLAEALVRPGEVVDASSDQPREATKVAATK
jgi:hypothetical protein